VDTEDVGDERVLLISGFPVQVCKAKAAIHQILTENTPVSEQLSVPQRSVGRIIGTTRQLPLLYSLFFLYSLPLSFFHPFPRLFWPTLLHLAEEKKDKNIETRDLLSYRTGSKIKLITSRTCVI
jgi:hypothetical protein